MGQDMFPLSTLQKEIWVNQMLHPDTALFNVGGYARIDGAIDTAVFEKALKHVVYMHDALRIRLHESLEAPQQSVAYEPAIVFDVKDFTGNEQAAIDWMQRQHAQVFPLYDSFLYRFVLCKVADDQYLWFTQYHYLIADGKTLSIVVQDVAKSYNAMLEGDALPEAPLSYQQYVRMDQAYMCSDLCTDDREYWQRKFRQLPSSLLETQYELAFADTEEIPSERTTLELSGDVFDQLEAFANNQGLAVGNVLLALFYVYFAKINQQDEFVVGMINLLHRNASSQDKASSFEHTAGFFMNVTPVLCDFSLQCSFSDLLQNLGQQLKVDAKHARLPLGEINRQAKVNRDNRHRSQLFELELAYIDFDCDVSLGDAPLRFQFLTHGWEQYALTVYIERFHAKGVVPVHFDYNQAYFSSIEMRQLAKRFNYLLQQVLSQPDKLVADLAFMPKAEYKQVVSLFNDTQKSGFSGKCVHQLFEAQVDMAPDASAVLFADQTMSYVELNSRANQLAHYLFDQGIKPEMLIGVCVERSVDMLIALLATLKVGAAYVPLDPNYPVDRLAYMLEDSGVTVLLTQAPYVDVLAEHCANVFSLDKDWSQVAGYPQENLALDIKPQNLAYIIYTSGSTGKPKGVMLEHAGLSNLVQDHSHRYGINRDSRVLQFVSLSFDVATADIFMSLCSGASLYLPSAASQALEEGLLQLLREKKITHVQLPAAVLAALPVEVDLPDLQVIATGGEAPSAKLVKQWAQGRRYFNVYGPTEATVCVSMAQCNGSANRQPIGHAITNTQIYILDEAQCPTPIGVAGELYIGGVGLARGYLNRDDLTEKAFIKNPIPGTPSERLYRSGDLARYLPDGQLEFLGRIDQQIKIRGYRIELGEIEAAISQCHEVRDNVVVLHESSSQGKRLVAYLLVRPGFDRALLRDQLTTKLPDYMLPAVFVTLDAMPFTPNGKVDRKQLAERAVDYQSLSNFVAPRSPEEKKLAECWMDVLEIEDIGIHDNFFEMGGDSLSGMQLVTHLHKMFDQDFQLATIFRYPTIAELAGQLQAKNDAVHRSIVPVIDQAVMPLSFSQEEVWRHNQQAKGDTSYNICNGFLLQGTLNESVLHQCFMMIMQRHHLLQTGFHENDGEPVQKVQDDVSINLTRLDLSHWQGSAQTEAVKQALIDVENIPFDLEQAPLWRVQLLHLSVDQHVLIVCFHHIIEDAWSIQILLKEFADLYQAGVTGQAYTLEPLNVQYSDFAYWQRQHFTPNVLQSRYRYWQALLADKPEPLRLPIDKPCTLVESRKTYASGVETFSLNEKLTARLRNLGQEQGSTLSVVLLTAYVCLLHQYSKQTDLVIGMPMSKRNHHQVEPLIGYFSGMSVLRVKLAEASNFLQVLSEVQQAMQKTLENQDLTMKQVWNALQLPWSGEQQGLFRTVFNFIPVPRKTIQLPELSLEPMALKREKMVRDLVIGLWDKDGSGQELEGFFRYRKDLFEAATIQHMMQHFLDLLMIVVECPEVAVDTLLPPFDADSKSLRVIP